MTKLEDKVLEVIYNPGRIILWIIIIAAIYIAAKKTKGFFSELFARNYATTIDVSDGSTESYQKSQYYAWADRLYHAMKGFGTDEDTIYSILSQLKTQADWVALVRAFGTRDKESLTEWLNGELSREEINKANKILTKIGISI